MRKLLIITQKVNQDDQLLGFFIEWIKEFADKFKKVTVLCLEKGEFDLPENVRVISLGKEIGRSKLLQLFSFYYHIYSQRKDYDVVFVHMNPIWVTLGGPAWHMMNKKIFLWYTHKAVTIKLKLAEKMADVIFTASKESFRLPSKKLKVTGHGIDTDLFRPNHQLSDTDSSLLKILSVGRIAPVKNYEILIDVAIILKNQGINFIVTMIGEAPLEKDKIYEKMIKSKIGNAGLRDNFNFIGKVTNRDLPRYYQSHDIFIHLSKTGSLDKSLLEAMACGMNVLSSNDAAKAFLSDEFKFNDDDSKILAKKIESLKARPAPSTLRDYVVSHHNLRALIGNISDIISK